MNEKFELMLNTINECVNLENVKNVECSKSVYYKKLTVGGFKTWIYYCNGTPRKIEMLGNGQFIEVYNK